MILITNDDGIDAPGIKALCDAIDENYIVVAPSEVMSECGHRVTTMKEIKIDKRSESSFAVDGTPADCLRVALSILKLSPALVLSGINQGGNLGVDVYISGTVAATREAAIHGIPAIALSHYIKRGQELNWEFATQCAKHVLQSVDLSTIKPKEYLNVNFPHLNNPTNIPEISNCPLSKDPLPTDYIEHNEGWKYQGVYSKRQRTAGTDVDICFSDKISLTKLSL